MWLLILEAAAAFFLLAFIVWWTMFSGRPQPPETSEPATQAEPGRNDNRHDRGRSAR